MHAWKLQFIEQVQKSEKTEQIKETINDGGGEILVRSRVVASGVEDWTAVRREGESYN